MENKEISKMTHHELILYIHDKIYNIKGHLLNYSEYYNIKTKTYESFNNSHLTKLKDELKNDAYAIRDIFEYVEWAYNKQIIIDSILTKLNAKPKRGEIWTCQLGKNIGSEENKIRPIIIIQNNTGNERSPTTIIVPISNIPKKIAVHIELKRSDYTLEEGETEEITGTILCEQIKVISKARLGRHIATLKDEFISKFLNPKLKRSIKL